MRLMGRFEKSRIVYRDLESVFRDDTNRNIDGYAGALAVLFEDLRIEISGLANESPVMDVAGHRVSYFLRRSIATLKEFAHAVTDLDSEPAFAPIKAKFDTDTAREWQKAVRFFHRYGRTLITPVRHSIGGHFRHETAEFAIENDIKGNVPGGIEITSNEKGVGGVVFHFAKHIANAAITQKVPGKNFERRFKYLLRRIMAGYRHAVRATEAITINYLWIKFDK